MLFSTDGNINLRVTTQETCCPTQNSQPPRGAHCCSYGTYAHPRYLGKYLKKNVQIISGWTSLPQRFHCLSCSFTSPQANVRLERLLFGPLLVSALKYFFCFIGKKLYCPHPPPHTHTKAHSMQNREIKTQL